MSFCRSVLTEALLSFLMMSTLFLVWLTAMLWRWLKSFWSYSEILKSFKLCVTLCFIRISENVFDAETFLNFHCEPLKNKSLRGLNEKSNFSQIYVRALTVACRCCCEWSTSCYHFLCDFHRKVFTKIRDSVFVCLSSFRSERKLNCTENIFISFCNFVFDLLLLMFLWNEIKA